MEKLKRERWCWWRDRWTEERFLWTYNSPEHSTDTDESHWDWGHLNQIQPTNLRDWKLFSVDPGSLSNQLTLCLNKKAVLQDTKLDWRRSGTGLGGVERVTSQIFVPDESHESHNFFRLREYIADISIFAENETFPNCWVETLWRPIYTIQVLCSTSQSDTATATDQNTEWEYSSSSFWLLVCCPSCVRGTDHVRSWSSTSVSLSKTVTSSSRRRRNSRIWKGWRNWIRGLFWRIKLVIRNQRRFVAWGRTWSQTGG